jgi:hypothetical protein
MTLYEATQNYEAIRDSVSDHTALSVHMPVRYIVSTTARNSVINSVYWIIYWGVEEAVSVSVFDFVFYSTRDYIAEKIRTL